MQDQFAKRKIGMKNFQVRNYEEFEKRVGEADVVVVSGMWKNDIIPKATNLKFIQSISAGMDQYSKEQLAAKGVRLCSASGVNARAVAEHAIALMLAISRRLPEARDNQHKKFWRGMIGDLTQREDEIGGKTVLIVGTGQDRQPSRRALQGLRHEGARHPPRSRRRARTAPTRSTAWPSW